MRLSRAAWPVLASSWLVAFCAVGCGSSEGSSNVSGSGGSSSTAGTKSGPDLGSAAGPTDGDGTDSSGGSTSVGEACAGDLIMAERIPLDMYVMLDVSGSMTEATIGDPNVTKWTAVSSAISDFVSDPASDGIGVGLQVFPVFDPKAPKTCTLDTDCGTYGPCLSDGCWPPINGLVDPCFTDNNCAFSQTCTAVGTCSKDKTLGCDREQTATCADNTGDYGDCVVEPSFCLSINDCKPASYATPAAEIAALPGAKDALLKVIAASTPQDPALTPTGPALTGAIQEAKTWATAHTDHQVIAVLATDGLPTLKTKGNVCTPVTSAADINAVVSLAGNGRLAAPSISTFVIGVVGPDDANAPDILNAIAMAGGSGDAFIVDTAGNVQMQFRDALDQIRAAGLSCDLIVPQAAAGKTIDYSKVNVDFSGDPQLAKVDDAAHCDAIKGGWYYDIDPAQGTPTRILTCPVTCDAFKKTDMGSVKIELGCKTRVVVK